MTTKLLKPLHASYMGNRITRIGQILKLASKGKNVYYRGGRTPAAFLQNFQARFLQTEIDRSVIYNYIPKGKQ